MAVVPQMSGKNEITKYKKIWCEKKYEKKWNKYSPGTETIQYPVEGEQKYPNNIKS